jgi:2-polyprenyl-3-methyl-5-hydroxy-6-metoxy-1,4-benzoquinol methylase
VDRIEFLRQQVAGKRVIHVGFGGAMVEEDRSDGLDSYWLHGQIAGVAAGLVGIDVDERGVEAARARGYEAYTADCEDAEQLRRLGIQGADVVLAGEIIEHMEAPGSFLDAMHVLIAPGGRIIVTTPNAASLLNPLAAMGRYELVNPTHVAVYSWYTLTNILRRHDWEVAQFVTYHYPLPPVRSESLGIAAGRVLARVQRRVARLWPFLDFGLIAVAGEASVAVSPQ